MDVLSRRFLLGAPDVWHRHGVFNYMDFREWGSLQLTSHPTNTSVLARPIQLHHW